MNYEQTVTELEEYFTENQETDEDIVIISLALDQRKHSSSY
jgi:hypothetical protein